MFGWRKRRSADGRFEECAGRLKDLEQRFDAYARVIRTLLSQLKDFSMDIKDIDDFKRINDTYGHPIGDRVILALADVCRQMIRRDDFLARYGGEEFGRHFLPPESSKAAIPAHQYRNRC